MDVYSPLHPKTVYKVDICLQRRRQTPVNIHKISRKMFTNDLEFKLQNIKNKKQKITLTHLHFLVRNSFLKQQICLNITSHFEFNRFRFLTTCATAFYLPNKYPASNMSQFKTWLRWEDFPRLPTDTHSAVSQLPTTWPQLTAPGHAGTRPGEDHKAAAWVTGLGSSRQRRLSKMLSHSERGLSRYREMLVSWWLPPCEVVEWEDNLKVLSRLQRGLSASLKLLFPLVKRINTRQHLAFVCNENWYNHNFLFSQTTMRSTLFLLITLGSIADTWQLAEHSIVFVLVFFLFIIH